MHYIKYICRTLLVALFLYLLYKVITFFLSSNLTESKLLLLSSVILTIITAVYVLVTFLMLLTQQKANKINSEFMEKQSETSIMPIFHCGVKAEDDEIKIIISNVGNMPAYDVDVRIAGCFLKEEVSEYIQEEPIKKYFADGEDIGSIHLIDATWYPLFAHKKRVIFNTAFPVNTDSYTILLQYSNIQGSYYSNIFWLIDDSDGMRNSFQIASLYPDRPIKHQKIELNQYNFYKKTPDHVKKYYENCILDSVNYIRKGSKDLLMEDRGEWFDIA